MEEGRKEGGSSSSSSFTSELFGSKESPSSSAGIFGSIFSPPSKVLGKESLRSEVYGRKQDFLKEEEWCPKPGPQDDKSNSSEGESQSGQSRDMSSIYQEQGVQPCHLSSSIYYGGQDVYSHPQSTQNPGSNPPFKKDGGEDDSGSASRGNWWQGSLYY